jgi:hypothetical protein
MGCDPHARAGIDPRQAREAEARRKAAKAGRDAGSFIPWLQPVQLSPGWRRCGHTGRSLLMDVVHSGVNGKLVAADAYLKPLGWTSREVIARALKDLIECGLLVETRKGARPNRAAWYAVTWLDLKHTEGLDIDPKKFKRGGYLTPEKQAATPDRARTSKATKARKVAAKCLKAGYLPVPSDGHLLGVACTVPRSIDQPVRPSNGAMEPDSGTFNQPSDGPYLESCHLLRDGRGAGKGRMGRVIASRIASNYSSVRQTLRQIIPADRQQ